MRQFKGPKRRFGSITTFLTAGWRGSYASADSTGRRNTLRF
jgi:hypothetical protein